MMKNRTSVNLKVALIFTIVLMFSAKADENNSENIIYPEDAIFQISIPHKYMILQSSQGLKISSPDLLLVIEFYKQGKKKGIAALPYGKLSRWKKKKSSVSDKEGILGEQFIYGKASDPPGKITTGAVVFVEKSASGYVMLISWQKSSKVAEVKRIVDSMILKTEKAKLLDELFEEQKTARNKIREKNKDKYASTSELDEKVPSELKLAFAQKALAREEKRLDTTFNSCLKTAKSIKNYLPTMADIKKTESGRRKIVGKRVKNTQTGNLFNKKKSSTSKSKKISSIQYVYNAHRKLDIQAILMGKSNSFRETMKLDFESILARVGIALSYKSSGFKHSARSKLKSLDKKAEGLAKIQAEIIKLAAREKELAAEVEAESQKAEKEKTSTHDK